MATRKPESSLQEKIQQALRKRGAYVVKVHGSIFQPDTVDLIVCFKGRFVGLEAKILGNEATPRQAKRLRQIADAGGVASVVFSVEDAMRVLDEMERSS